MYDIIKIDIDQGLRCLSNFISTRIRNIQRGKKKNFKLTLKKSILTTIIFTKDIL